MDRTKITNKEVLHISDSYGELLHSKVFDLANELALAGYENEAARMHDICNYMKLLKKTI